MVSYVRDVTNTAPTRRVAGHWPGGRAVLFGGLMAIAVIIGLLNHCTLNVQTHFHDETVVGPAVVHQADAGTAHGIQQHHPDADQTGHPVSTAVALCAMALVAFVITLGLPSRLARFSRPAQPRWRISDVAPPQLLWLRRPSLLTLCISRT